MVLLWAFFFYLLWKILEWARDRIRFTHVRSGTVVLITGGCQGLGKELAFLYASYHCKIVVWDITPELFSNVEEEILKKGGIAVMVQCDITSEEQVRKAAQMTLNITRKVDILINNAGLAHNLTFANLTNAKFEKIFKVNVLGGTMVTKEFLHCTEKIVVISSVLSKLCAEKASDYCGTKHALDGIYNSLRLELKRNKKSIGITMVHPAHMSTQMFEGYFAKNLQFVKSIDPKVAAKAIYTATCLGKEELYLPFYFWHLTIFTSLLPPSINYPLSMWLSEGALDKTKSR